MSKKYRIKLVESSTGLTERELQLMRNCLSDLTSETNIQLIFAEAILDACENLSSFHKPQDFSSYQPRF